MTVVELGPGRTALGARAMCALRTHLTPEQMVAAVDDTQRATGYRLVGIFREGVDDVVAVAGFREAWCLSWGHHVYVDDLSTLPDERGQGHGDRLVEWLIAEARRLGCGQLHLDSGVGLDRAAAHRLYLRHHLRISAHHFQIEL